MFRLLLKLCFWIGLQSSSANSQESNEIVVVGMLPEALALPVFSGPESEMPKGADFLIAIAIPKTDGGEELLPTDLRSAMAAMHEALPSWYINALKSSSDCQVVVNERSYDTIVGRWFVRQWKIGDDDSPIRLELMRIGVPRMTGNYGYINALIDGLCRFSKSGNLDDALDFMSSNY